ncbi:glycosyltransferase family 4 protein [Bradyrhizobium sp. DASA03007]|uniref:glycosyltransferase family 4 protein n=1 Tax=unclassified Bradyrhizobium TaxID=2631580 RepID=UPI003F6F2FDC
MTIERCFIVAIGQIPPPVTGLAYITSEMIRLLREIHEVATVNISPAPGLRGFPKHAGRASRVLRGLGAILWYIRKKERVCYLVCEGDWGLLYTILLSALARVCRYRIYLHHHSFDYISKPKKLMRALVRVGGPRATHLFLCQQMRDQFSSAYNRPSESRILSNAAFVPPTIRGQKQASTLTVGLLSNLTREKGLYTFIDLMRRIKSKGIDIKGILAGPIGNEEDRILVERAIAELKGTLDYWGPIYGDEKKRFYHDLDVFIFPTEYAHEAQPTVIFEALSAGNAIVAFGRGCIPEQVRDNGLIVEIGRDFIDPCLEYLNESARRISELRRDHDRRARSYEQKHLLSLMYAQTFLDSQFSNNNARNRDAL